MTTAWVIFLLLLVNNVIGAKENGAVHVTPSHPSDSNETLFMSPATQQLSTSEEITPQIIVTSSERTSEASESRTSIPWASTVPNPTLSKEKYLEKKESIASIHKLAKNYFFEIEVYDLRMNDSWAVMEYKKGDTRAIYVKRDQKPSHICIYNTTTLMGHIIEGIRCERAANLPHSCLCQGSHCYPYIPVSTLIHFATYHNASMKKETLGNSKLLTWTVNNREDHLSLVFILSPANKWTLSSVTLQSSAQKFTQSGIPVHVKYHVISTKENEVSIEKFLPPIGVYCGKFNADKVPLPRLADHFSITLETIMQDSQTISYETNHFDSAEKLVAFEYRPHLHSSPGFVFNFGFYGDPVKGNDVYRVIHDFKAGIQYTINERSTNCSIESIPPSALDAMPLSNHHLRLRHANELLIINPERFEYSGQRHIRDIPCDVWVAEKPSSNGRYSTIEIYFTHVNWSVEVEVLNHVQLVPLGVSTYVTDPNDSSHFSKTFHTFFYGYSVGHPSWKKFDISPCLSRINRLFLVLTLEVNYSQLVKNNMDLALDTLKRAIAGVGGVSPLRITDITVTGGSDDQVDVWFVLLEKPDITGPVVSPRPQLNMEDSYQLLQDITNNHQVTLKLDLSPSRHILVTIKQGSLRMTSEAIHPRSRHKSFRFVKAGYTAGSMAGLGFSMVILGICVGVLVGFVLWKKSSVIPYLITE